jgi:hypothetical protein
MTAGGLRGLWRKAYRCVAPPGLDSIFLLPTLHGFAGARLQPPPQNAKNARVWTRGGLNNSAPAALGLGFGIACEKGDRISIRVLC